MTLSYRELVIARCACDAMMVRVLRKMPRDTPLEVAADSLQCMMAHRDQLYPLEPREREETQQTVSVRFDVPDLARAKREGKKL